MHARRALEVLGEAFGNSTRAITETHYEQQKWIRDCKNVHRIGVIVLPHSSERGAAVHDETRASHITGSGAGQEDDSVSNLFWDSNPPHGHYRFDELRKTLNTLLRLLYHGGVDP